MRKVTTSSTTVPSSNTRVKRSYAYQTSNTSKIFGALHSESDEVTDERVYYYDSNNGRLLAEVGVTGGMGTAYTYDALGRLTSAKPAVYYSSTQYTPETGAENVSYTYDSYGNLSKITTGSTTYTLTYDVYGNTDTVKAGNNTLADYEYNPNNGKLIKITYGNGFIEEYVYNSLEMLEEVWYTYSSGTRTQAVEYYYTSEGQLYKSEDLISGRTTVYEYDADGRLTGSSEYDTADMKNNVGIFIKYNDKNLVSSISTRLEYSTAQSVGRLVAQKSFTYFSDGRLSQVRHSATGQNLVTSTYTYDYFDRVTRIATNYGRFSGTVSYSYKTTSGKTSGLVSSYASTVDGTTTGYNYTYDANGNITKIVSGGKEIRYVYDNLGQLLREDNGVMNKTYVYTYDDAGNITSKKTYALTAAASTPVNPTATATYGYSTGTWGDMLTSYNGNSITYDAVGDPLC